MSFFNPGMLLFVVASFSVTARAKGVCDNVVSYKDVVNCVEKQSPEILQLESEVSIKSGQAESANQWVNPELSLQTVSGTLDSERRTETDVSLAFPIALGGKRSARQQVAKAELQKSGKQLEIQRSEVRKNALIKLNRLRQIYDEVALVEESRETFAKLIKQYQDRPALSPEQEVSLTVFKTARGDYNFKKIAYDEELGELAAYFKLSTGLSLEEVKKVLPPVIKKWPVFDGTTGPGTSAYTEWHDSEVIRAEGELENAKGEAWPTLMIGPSAKFTQEASGEMQQWGVNLSMPLPVFNLNGGEKKAAAAGVQSAHQKRDQWREQLSERRQLLEKTYRTSVESLNENPNGKELEQRHHKIENQFMRGLINSALVIEAHRSLVDFTKSRNEHETKALEIYLELLAISGQKVELTL